MNTLFEIISDLVSTYEIKALKAEFETEGAYFDEVLDLISLSSSFNIDLNLKIGGCGAIRDLSDAQKVGVPTIIAPMIETAYSLEKFVKSVETVYGNDLPALYINIETDQGVRNISELLASPYLSMLKGIVIGRDDLTDSLGHARCSVNSQEIAQKTDIIASAFKAKGLEIIVGGSIDKGALAAFKNLPSGLPDKFETRKVVFDKKILDEDVFPQAVARALEFEVEWLKSRHYLPAWQSQQDSLRIEALQHKIVQLQLPVQI